MGLVWQFISFFQCSMDQPNSQTQVWNAAKQVMLYFQVCHKHNSLQLGPIRTLISFFQSGPWFNPMLVWKGYTIPKQLVCSIPRLSAPPCHLLGKIKTMGTFFSTRHLCLQSKCLTMVEIVDVSQRRMFPQRRFCPENGRMVLRVQGWRPQAVYGQTLKPKVNKTLCLHMRLSGVQFLGKPRSICNRDIARSTDILKIYILTYIQPIFHLQILFFKKMGHSRPLFLSFCLFNTQLTVNKCSINI